MIMLYGPGGTGKSHSVMAIQGEFRKKGRKLPVLSISVGSMLDKYVPAEISFCSIFAPIHFVHLFRRYIGESEKRVAAMMSLSKKLAPCLLVLEEVDSVFQVGFFIIVFPFNSNFQF